MRRKILILQKKAIDVIITYEQKIAYIKNYTQAAIYVYIKYTQAAIYVYYIKYTQVAILMNKIYSGRNFHEKLKLGRN